MRAAAPRRLIPGAHTSRRLTSLPIMAGSAKPPVNLLRGWPSSSLLPTADFRDAAQTALTNPSSAVAALTYGPERGYTPLREEIARCLSGFSGSPNEPQRLCVTGGASQNLADILQAYTDQLYTRRVWMVCPSCFLACRIFADAGFGNSLRAVPEDGEGVDIGYLEAGMNEGIGGASANETDVSCSHPFPLTFLARLP